MKKYLYLIGCILAAAVISGCNKESGIDSEEEVRVTGTQYMPVTLVMPSATGTRADEAGNQQYEWGEPYESAINPAKSYFLFFDKAGNYLANGQIKAAQDDLDADGCLKWATNSAPGTGTSAGNSTAKTDAMVILGPTKQFPAQVVAILNYEGTLNDLTNGMVSLEDLFTTTTTPIPMTEDTPTTAGTFVMSNSLYIETNGYTMVKAATINENNIAESQEAALATGVPVTIRVEREISKVTIGLGGELATSTTDDGKPYRVLQSATAAGGDSVIVFNNNTRIPSYAKFRIVIDGWGVNATNSEGAIMKQYLTSWEAATSNFMNTGFNSYGFQRCFWEADRNYGEGKYDSSASNGGTGAYENLTYMSWNQVQGSLSTDPGYYHPNTAQRSVQHTSAGDTLSVPALLVAAHVEYVTSETAEGLATSTNWQPYTSAMYYNNGNYMNYEGMTSHLAVDLGDLGYYYSADPANAQADTSALTRFEISNLTFGGYPGAELNSGRVQIATIELDGTKTVNNAEYTLVKDGTAVTDQSGLVAEMNQNLSCITTGAGIQRYEQGACYYQVPIRHWQVDETGNNDFYGLVRNHSYKLTISDISRIGGPVNDKDEPLPVIPGDGKDYYIAAQLEVLSWVVKDQGEITL